MRLSLCAARILRVPGDSAGAPLIKMQSHTQDSRDQDYARGCRIAILLPQTSRYHSLPSGPLRMARLYTIRGIYASWLALIERHELNEDMREPWEYSSCGQSRRRELSRRISGATYPIRQVLPRAFLANHLKDGIRRQYF